MGYGIERDQIALLFSLGFAFSSLLGCFAGKFADRFGRKRSAMLLCGFGCITSFCRHFDSFPVLMVGRFFDGAHVSLLYTAFESWLVSEHFVRHGFSGALLGHSFAMMFAISYLVGAVCGLVGQLGVDLLPPITSFGPLHYGGWTFPFDLSALCQVVAGLYIAFNWSENYGEQPSADDETRAEEEQKGGESLMQAFFKAKVLLCCALVTCFESSMFLFVFSWTPALAPGGDTAQLPNGIIFTTFMMASLCGSAIYSMCSKVQSRHVLLCVFCVAAAALSVPALLGVSDESSHVNFVAFVVFEACVGIYFPAAAKMKSEYVDERYRTTIYNFFRTPMNATVVGVLYFLPSQTVVFQLLCGLLSAGTVLLVCFNIAPTYRGKALAPSDIEAPAPSS